MIESALLFYIYILFFTLIAITILACALVITVLYLLYSTR